MANNNDTTVIGRMIFYLKKSIPTQLQADRAMTLIGTMIEARAKMNTTRLKVVDNGTLRQSIRYEAYHSKNTTGVLVGSFGLKYAAMNEFGGPVSEKQFRAMMAALRHKPRRASKNVVTKSGSGWHWRERPYLRPAIISSQKYIMETLRAEILLGNAKK